MSRVNDQVNELLKQQSQQDSVIGYESKYHKQLTDNCIVNFLYPLTDAGLKLVEKGKYQEAITYFDKGLEIEPKNNDAKWSKAKTLQAIGEHDLALSLFEEVAEQSPTQDFSKEIAYSKEQLVLGTAGIVCGKGTIEKNGQCVPDTKSSKGGDCLIATATYGSELAP
jgi:tetratricopeptide (TPR) repeat protein